MNKRREKLYHMVHSALDALIESDVDVHDLDYRVKANKPRLDENKTRTMTFKALFGAFVIMSKDGTDPVKLLRDSMTRTFRVVERKALAAAIVELDKEPMDNPEHGQ